mmetsp:Transcript_50765/g.147859  ORF Transcript_50765/g.147859 Transcript_50765/m.147859 type:complete len:251 (+) Transcript_50765:865-1617(+)
MLHVAEHRFRGRALAQRPAHDDRLQARQGGAHDLCARGIRGLCRANCAVVARQFRRHQRGRGGGVTRRNCRGLRRSDSRPGFQRPLRALLAGGRPCRYRRDDAIHQEGAHLPGCARVRGLQHRRRHEGYEKRHRPAARSHERGRRDDSQQPLDADASGLARGGRHAREDARGHGLGCGDGRGLGRGLLHRREGREGVLENGRGPREVPVEDAPAGAVTGVRPLVRRRGALHGLGEVRAHAKERQQASAEA